MVAPVERAEKRHFERGNVGLAIEAAAPLGLLSCDSGWTLGDVFSRAGRPETVLNVPRAQATSFQWQGMGRHIHYAVDIPNGNTLDYPIKLISMPCRIHSPHLDGCIN